MAEIVSVRFRSEGKQYYFDPQGIQCRVGDGLIVETAGGLEYAICSRENFMLLDTELTSPLRPVIRPATPEDMEIVEKNREKEKYAFRVCQEKIAEHALDMKLVNVECSFEGNKILFFFTSDGRVDFRGLVKSLASVFHTRIELRQIGIRDEAKMLGGLGICGRPFCCSSFLRDFQPVSIKMAKTQNLSLNPTKISGTCGRLMCCLKYEQEAYEDLIKDAPHQDSFVETPDGVGTIISSNILREQVRVRLDDAPDTLKIYHNSEVRVVRSGKGKRPENYVAPPKEELEHLRRVTKSSDEEKKLEQAAITLALNEYMQDQDESQASIEKPAKNRRRNNKNKASDQRKQKENGVPPQLEDDLHEEGTKQASTRTHHRSRHRRGGNMLEIEENRRAAKVDVSVIEKEATDRAQEGEKKDGTSRRRRGFSKFSQGQKEKQDKRNDTMEKPTEKKITEGRKKRPYWHHRRKKNGGGSTHHDTM